jgi:hypothetical protein
MLRRSTEIACHVSRAKIRECRGYPQLIDGSVALPALAAHPEPLEGEPFGAHRAVRMLVGYEDAYLPLNEVKNGEHACLDTYCIRVGSAK